MNARLRPTVTRIMVQMMRHRDYPRFGPPQELCGSSDWTIAVSNLLTEHPTAVITMEVPGTGKISGMTTEYKAVVE